MKRKVFAVLMATAMTASMAACGNASSEASSSTAASTAPASEESAAGSAAVQSGETKDSITVAGIVFQDDQNMARMRKGYEDAVADAGEGVTLLTDNTNQDQSKESELINTYQSQNVDGICIAPLNADASVATLKAAAENGMKITLTNIDIADPDFIVAGYTSNEYNNAYLAGQEAATIIKEKHGDEKINIGVVEFVSLLPDQSKSRINGYLDALKDSGVEYDVVADQDGLSTDEALQTASGILTANPDLDVFVAAAEVDTLGCTVAVTNAGLQDQVMVFGYDGSDQISSMVADDASPLQVSVSQDPYTMGYEAMTALIKACRGEDYSETKGKFSYVDGIVLSCKDKDGVNEWRKEQGLEELK